MAKLLGVSRNTIYKYVPELTGGRPALAEATAAPEPTRSRSAPAHAQGHQEPWARPDCPGSPSPCHPPAAGRGE
ncbi:hypothetical protein ACIHCQ_29985 [Streptomyces sp. NPDC052236]|uniref:hypothetical protein n=1 Tax=Streptomyces sp. NPDC052236 TaxID=3365686 RepID=UPI0037D40DD5